MIRWPRERGTWLVVGVLVVLLGLLAALQYRWTGEIGRAEADRQRARLDRASQRFARELGRELGQVTMAFMPEFRPSSSADPRTALLERLDRWRETEHGGLVARLVLVTFSGSGEVTTEATDPEGREFNDAPFPPQLEPLRQRLADPARESPVRRGFRPEGLLANPPALPVPVIRPAASGEDGPPFRRGGFVLRGVALVELDEDYLRDALIPELAEVHFGPLDEGDYAVAVVRQGDGAIVYTSDPDREPEELARADVRLELPAAFGRLGSPRGPRGGRPPHRRNAELPPAASPGPGSQGADPAPRGPGPGEGPPPDWHQGAFEGAGSPWLLLVRHRGGSLAEAVATVRRRNLAVGLGILALLGATVALLTVGAQRARHLARQQLEFVAGVTHELHTPLAAIRSAGQNLADGVVSEQGQVRRYGELIQKEGTRLSGLVAQVLEFAGIESGSAAYSREPVRIADLVQDVVGNLALVVEQAGVELEVDVPEDLPEVQGDADALRRALENLVTNATKFARGGRWVGIKAVTGPRAGTVTVRVEDRGPGIPKAERDRVFEPFYRGGDARRDQSPGSGLGLSMVRHVVEAHRGRASVETSEEGGAAIVLQLPTMEGAEEAPAR
jgi:signal transduction histidine kinase